MKSLIFKRTLLNIHRGFTFVEVMVSLLVLTVMIIVLFACLTFIAGSAQRATSETEGNMRVVNVFELIEQYPYNMVTTNYFPTEYITDSDGSLVYAITTTIVEATSPTVHKNITVDYTWKEGGIQRHTRYYSIKPE